MRHVGDRARQAGRARAELQLRHRSDVRLHGEWRDRTASIRSRTKSFTRRSPTSYTELLSTYTAEGLCYRVDLRLRPDGSLGEVCISLDGAKSYYQTRARDWELQMLIKARVAAGDPRRRAANCWTCVEPLIYSTTLDFSAVEAVSVTRERISEKLSRRRLRQSRVRRQAGAGRHPRYRVPGAVPAALARRPRFRGCGTAEPCWRCRV